MNDPKILNILGYNTIKERIKDYSASNLGKHLAQEMAPSYNPKVILNQYDEVKEAVTILSEGKGLSLGGISDITPMLEKVEKGLFLQASELLKTSDFMRCIRHVKKSIEAYQYTAPKLYSYSFGLENFKLLEEKIEYCIEGNTVHSRASSTLKKTRDKINRLHSKRIDKLNKFLSSENHAKHIQEHFYSQRDGRYVIPIKASSRKFIEGTVIDGSSSGSTVYIEIASIQDLTVDIIMLEAQEHELCTQILIDLSNEIFKKIDEIIRAVQIIGKYDFIMAKGKYSIAIGGNEIEMRDDEVINLKGARHPMLGDEAIPLDIQIGETYRTLIITGPNTGGKTLTLKTVGLIVLMLQSGILPPVDKGSSLSLFNKVLVDIGDSQSIEQSLSTFSGHMQNLIDIVKFTSRRTLVLIDEIGTGTDPKDGSALGIAILETLYNRGAITLSSTHYSKIKEYSQQHDGFINGSMDFDKTTLKPLYKLCIGVAGESQALWISKRLGLDEKVIERAKLICKTHEYVPAKKISKFSKKKSRLDKDKHASLNADTNRVFYYRGDRVIINETGEHSLVFEHNFDERNITLFKSGQYDKVNEKRVTLDRRREQLYPQDYDLDQLFTSFKSRKLDKDIQKGRFKNIKELKKRFDNLN